MIFHKLYHIWFECFSLQTQFVSDTYLEALELDGLENSHPIEVPVGHPSEVDEIFDDISYNKGASVIRMLHKYLGDDVSSASLLQNTSANQQTFFLDFPRRHEPLPDQMEL